MQVNLPHLFIKDTAKTRKFTTPPRDHSNDPSKIRPERQRVPHADFLKNKFNEAWREATNAQIAINATDREGVYLEFGGEAGYELATKSLEDLKGSKKARLLNVRKLKENENDDNETTYATVFIPNRKRRNFLKKINNYRNDGNTNAALIETISQIKQVDSIQPFWQDDVNLIPDDNPVWCEVWLSSDLESDVADFESLLKNQRIYYDSNTIFFPERAVKLVKANRAQLYRLILLSDHLAEFRRSKELSSFWDNLSPHEQSEWAKELLSRIQKNGTYNDFSVCLLDTGVNNGHVLLSPILKDSDCQAVTPTWQSNDSNGHGTSMAGIAAYGDLSSALGNNNPVLLSHCLESVKIIPPTGGNDQKLWGAITSQGVSLAEIQAPNRKRIFCMATTANETRNPGRPTSWSAELDQITSGATDEPQRLLIISAGNCNDYMPYYYKQCNAVVNDPNQSWNAITVGAYTEKREIKDPTLSGYIPMAPYRGLSPFSTTSLNQSWGTEWPLKPDILMEGGNLACGFNNSVCQCNDLMDLSTYHQPTVAQFTPFGMTSCATAKAAWFAAQIQTQYPNYWPETIRALMVHSAQWTDQMIQDFGNGMKNKTDVRRLIKVCGYGVPDLQKALYCASNSLTLIAQEKIQPFQKRGSAAPSTKDMHFYELPWPKEELESLQDMPVEMRVTLSYFIEPGPGERGWKDRYRYPSHLLRFELISPNESKKEFLYRINKADRNEADRNTQTGSPSDHWKIGSNTRDKGSLHSDIWQGTAAELASSNLMAIIPRIGWWKQRANLMCYNKETRYSLIVSITTPSQEVDIYTPVANKIAIATPISLT
ncbi:MULTISPECIES: S8 family peptidase [Dethiosulfovibrio]|uniref:S8 family peptidase n=2 Tax=Dethiosulfovibrio TaxID=47054 RepID=A0ABS9EPG3_9BACT|nr:MULTISPECIES: S8 family peptidase [Dethiosulfovibrio]MCF4114721.1 S8 family peptidase [Dethiosulfovibrio russensis]MCF4143074.1 S8 family peptidase [Dethiosulfovibrio marinus]MCF4145226.1 S8 family peptidase [Dethiosulfovibrio acidaminovorans]